MYVKDKIAVVTGGLSGIGFVTVQHLLRHGASFVGIFDLPDPDEAKTLETLSLLEKEFGKNKYVYYTCDTTNYPNFVACFDEIRFQRGYINILINNAGICDEQNFEKMIDVNYTAVVQCTMYAIECMRLGKSEDNRGGCVVNVGSIFGLINIPVLPVYNATKHAVVSFVRSMKDHNRVLGIRIMCICPGMTKTFMTTKTDPKKILFDFIPEELIEKHRKLYLQSPENVAAAVVEILECGKEGDVWVVKDDEPPFPVKEAEEVESLRIPF